MPSDSTTTGAGIVSKIGRRRFIAAGASVGVAGVAGCTQIIDAIAGLVLDDVNVFNESNRRRAGSITVTDPNGETVLDERFDLPASDDEDDTGSGGNESTNGTDGNGSSDGTADTTNGTADTANGTQPANESSGDGSSSGDDEGSPAVYEGVLTDAGEYTVAIDLDDDSEMGDVDTAEETVEVTDVENEHVVVGLFGENGDEPILFTVIEKLSDLQEVDAGN